ncbi:EH domain binding protein epsin 2 [Taphrina deformans PYCC 5710]|uniref:EH domain binding protein epsin 2 n=1 Tax=Taphrina deformans (strain PYCC 5710 / ATCC 11124 / CBS 356.35 / IMI 108563 / JCM 9778 / NBRC 8474) TaxID=1097556 RepID=R4X8A2_TAPDE|nr:EH domain binding protein epsin 2 [Taphrina deformans PYCC 5710]|eukprot:CCG81784.1 EH domain binding protein epsin 2 [Taphrina deformans PYCC 5710]
MSKGLVRSGKNLLKGFSSIQVKVRSATSNDPWGPSGSEMRDIAELTQDHSAFAEIMDMLDKRMNDRGKNWRHVYKALTVFDYCLHMGSENVVLWGKDNIYLIKTLREFIYIDDDGKDQGHNIRSKAKDITSLLQDDDRLRSERKNRSYMASRLQDDEPRPLRPQRTGNSTRAGRRSETEDESQDPELRRALEESKRQAEVDARKRRGDPAEEDDDLARALKLSEEEEEARRRHLAEESENNLFDDSNDQQQGQSYNPYQQQQQQVDFFGNPIYGDNMPLQNTGYLQNAYSQVQQPQMTGMYAQNTGGFYPQQQPQASPYDDYGGGAHDFLTAQNTGMNAATKIERQATGKNNPYAQNAAPAQPPPAQRLEPVKTGSNNPFAQFGNFNNQQPVQQPYQPPQAPSLNDVNASRQNGAAFAQYQQQQALKPQRTKDDGRYADLAALIGTGTGADTFGNTGAMRVAAHHTANPAFMNSAGSSSAGVIRSQQTGHNPFIQAQRTGGGSAPAQQPSYTGGQRMAYVGTQQTGGFAYPGQQQQHQQQYQQQPQGNYQQQSYQQQGYGNQQSLIDL